MPGVAVQSEVKEASHQEMPVQITFVPDYVTIAVQIDYHKGPK